MKKINIAIVGAGNRGMYTYTPCLNENSDLCKIVAVVEPKKGRRDLFAQKYNIKDEYIFENMDEFFEYENFENENKVDAIIICTNDYKHYEIAKIALENGYHVLLEKPMSNRLDGLIYLNDIYNKYDDKIFMVSNILRYTPFFNELKNIIDSKKLGDLISIKYDDNISYFDFVHSYVRGNWRNSTDTSQLSLSKGCSDMDILLYLLGSNCKKISSFGSLKYFKKENFKSEMADNCLNCMIEKNCPYSAKKIYLEKESSLNNTVHLYPTKENLLDILKKGPYGKCVFRCDNNVYDNMNTIIEFKNGITATLNMSGFNKENEMILKLEFSNGEVIGKFRKNEILIRDFISNKEILINPSKEKDVILEANRNVIKDFINKIIKNKNDLDRNYIESHVMAFAAEYSIVSDESIYIDEFYKSAVEITKEIEKVVKNN